MSELDRSTRTLTFRNDVECITFGALPYDVFALGMAHFFQCVGYLTENVLAQVVECFDAEKNERERNVLSTRPTRVNSHAYFFSSSRCSVCFCMPARIITA